MQVKTLPYIDRFDRRRFWKRVHKNGPVPAHRPELGPCWIWQLKRGEPATRYGTFRYKGEDFPAHRVAYLIAKGRIRRGLWPDHLCRVEPCVNPDHLEAVTMSVNVLRGYRDREKAISRVALNGTGFLMGSQSIESR